MSGKAGRDSNWCAFGAHHNSYLLTSISYLPLSSLLDNGENIVLTDDGHLFAVLPTKQGFVGAPWNLTCSRRK